MNKKIMSGLVAGVVIFGGALAVGAGMNDDSRGKHQEQEVKVVGINQGTKSELATMQKEMITVEKAKAIVLAKQDGFVDSVELKQKSGRSYYEVEIKNGKEYEFKIDAATGEILSSSVKKDDDWVGDDKGSGKSHDKFDDKGGDKDRKEGDDKGGDKGPDKGDDNGKDNQAKITTPNKAVLTSEEAKAIAAKKINGTVREIQLEEEHGRLIYKIEFTKNMGKAEVELDAASGKVLKVERN